MSRAWAFPIVAVALSQVAVLATSIYLHRTLAHRSLRLHPVTDFLFRAVLWLTTGQCRQQWVAVHRKHHAFTDREGDPHSPRLLGFWRVQLFNVYYYVRERRDPLTIATFAPDLPEDRLDRAVFPMVCSAWAWVWPCWESSSGSGRVSWLGCCTLSSMSLS